MLLSISIILISSFSASSLLFPKNNSTRTNDADSCYQKCEDKYSSSSDLTTCKTLCRYYDGECPGSYSDCVNDLANRANGVIVGDMCDILCPGGKTGLIVGVVVAVIVVIGLIVGCIIVCCCVCYKRGQYSQNNNNTATTTNDPTTTNQYPMDNQQQQQYSTANTQEQSQM